jgi:NhaA family Na+:H+ antiporter
LTDDTPRNKLDRPVDGSRDHVLGPADAPITLVEYGSYACPHCRVANEEIAKLRDRFGDRMRYVFRQRPLAGSELARPAAELAECAAESGRFWSVHVELMTRSATLTDEDLRTVAAELGVHGTDAESAPRLARAAARVEEDEQSARASGVSFTPTFFINGRRYDGPWDETSLAEAMLGSLGHRVQSAALDFASWAPSAGVLLLLATLAAIGLTNSEVGPAFQAFWKQPAGLDFGGTGFRMTLLHWINDGLLALFFLVVGLEVKREFTTGRLANRRSAALPVAAAVGGLVVPAALYLAAIPSGPWLPGAGVPMPTDTAFAVALIVLLGRRVPVELRVFLTAAAIVDDIGTIGIVALAYSSEL